MSEAYFRSLVEHSTDLVSRHDRDGVCLYASAAAQSLLGVAPADLVGRGCHDRIHPADVPAAVRARREVLRSTEPSTVVCRLRHASGAWVWVEVTSHSLTDDAGAVVQIQCATRDVSDRKAVQDRVAQAEEQVRLTLDGAPIAMALASPDGPLLRVNQALCTLFGYSMDELLTMTFQQLSHPADLDADLHQLRRLLAGQVPGYRLEKRYLRADGTVIWGLLSVGLVRAVGGRPRHLVAQLLDVTDRRAEYERLRRLAERDPLTGLYNRRRFHQEVERQLGRAHRYQESAVVLLLDIDGFKDINDAHGHHGGDQVLRRVADVLRSQTRDSDTVARLGGDEFAVLLPIGSAEAAMSHAAPRVIDLIRAALATSASDDARDSPDVVTHASVGVALLDAHSADVDAVLIAADQAMYRDKQQRRDRG